MPAEIGRSDPGRKLRLGKRWGDLDLRPYFRLFLCYGVYSKNRTRLLPTSALLLPKIYRSYQSYLVIAILYRQA